MLSLTKSSFHVQVCTSANDIPLSVWQAFNANPRQSNIMFPHAKKARQNGHRPTGDVWIVCSSAGSDSSAHCVEFVLSCTEGPIGSYPIFIFTPIPAPQLYPDHYTPRLRKMIHTLLEVVPPERVFSVFSLDTISFAFASIWTKETGIPLDRDPEYYAAKLTYCTRRTFKSQQVSEPRGLSYELRLASEADIFEAAELCHGFTAASEPFVLSMEQARQEAALLVRSRNLWIHRASVPGQRSEIASIVAVTRTSDTAAAITKVYTNPRWRSMGCAERLTRFVCERLLESKESVVLYVAHNNPAASKVYHRVGFVGLSPENDPVDGIDSWLELGFERDMVELGHW